MIDIPELDKICEYKSLKNLSGNEELNIIAELIYLYKKYRSELNYEASDFIRDMLKQIKVTPIYF